MQIKVETNIYYVNNQIRELREWKTKRMRKKKFFFAHDICYTSDGKPFYRLFKWFPLMLN